MKKNSNKITAFEWILIGFIFHTIGGFFFVTSKFLCYSLCGIGLLMIFYNAIYNFRHRLPFTGIVRSLFIIYLCWNIFVILRPFFIGESFSSLGFSPINQLAFLAFLIPFISLLKFSTKHLNPILFFNYVYGFIGIAFFLFFFRDIFSVQQFFDEDDYQEYIGVTGIPTAFLFIAAFNLLWFSFLSKPSKYIAIITWGIGIFISAFAARRNEVFYYILIFVFFLFQYLFNSKIKNKLRIITIISAILVIAGIYLFNNANSLFSLLISRLDEDSRSGVEGYFYQSFDGKTLDWIIGRGINGTYYCPYFKDVNRNIIETGYLQMILKGGIIYLGLFVFFLLYSAFLGFFRTNNMMTKAMALYLLTHVIWLIPSGLPRFNFEYAIVWIFVLFCQSKKYRSLSNNVVRNNFISKSIGFYKSKNVIHNENTLVR